jgi:DNA helicase-2/ATP-dependent DNA helicase PcrA
MMLNAAAPAYSLSTMSLQPVVPHETLDPRQSFTASSSAPYVLVTAGAGCGKTQVLGARLARLLDGPQQIAPESVLVLSFSSGGAKEVVERAQSLGLSPTSASRVTATTFHALSASILRKHGKTTQRNFRVASKSEQLKWMRASLEKVKSASCGLPVKQRDVSSALRQVSLWKELGLSAERSTKLFGASSLEGEVAAAAAYPIYQSLLQQGGCVDYADLPLQALHTLRQREDVLGRYRWQLRHILVDEFQDVSAVQYALLRLLAMGSPKEAEEYHSKRQHGMLLPYFTQQQGRHDDGLFYDPLAPQGMRVDVFAAADEDQRIYAWRGAGAAHLRQFCEDFPGAERHSWSTTHRLPLHILSCAWGLIKSNYAPEGRSHSDLNFPVTTQRATGARISVRGFWAAQDEAQWIAKEMKRFHDEEGVPYGSMAVMVRLWAQARDLEAALQARGVPYSSVDRDSVARSRFFLEPQVEKSLSLLRLCAAPHRNDADFERALGWTKGVDRIPIDVIKELARVEKTSLVEAANKLVGTGRLHAQAEAGVSSLVLSLRRWSGWVRAHSKCGQGERLVAVRSVLQEAGEELGICDVDCVQQLASSASQFPSIEKFILHAMLEGSEGGRSGGGDSLASSAAQLLSMHQCKGKEFDVVFLAGWEEGLFPLLPSMTGGQEEASSAALLEAALASHVQEERRLGYVALTRAKQHAFITHARRRQMNGQWSLAPGPSRFLSELPTRHLLLADAGGKEAGGNGLYGGFAPQAAIVFAGLKRQPRRAMEANTSLLPALVRPAEELIDLQSILLPARSRPSPAAVRPVMAPVKTVAAAASYKSVAPKVHSKRSYSSYSAPPGYKAGGLRRKVSVDKLMMSKNAAGTGGETDRLDPETIIGLMQDSRLSQASLKTLFRAILKARFHLGRGSIVVPGKGSVPISRCTARDLGAHIITLMAVEHQRHSSS